MQEFDLGTDAKNRNERLRIMRQGSGGAKLELVTIAL